MQTMSGPAANSYNFLRSKKDAPIKAAKPITEADMIFMSRMDHDTDARRRNSFINELKKHPHFKPSMLEPKSKFKEVSLTAGPVVKTIKQNRTGLEPRRPHQWGPLGGWY